MYLMKGEILGGVFGSALCSLVLRGLVIGGRRSEKYRSLACTFLEQILEGYLIFSVRGMEGRQIF